MKIGCHCVLFAGSLAQEPRVVMENMKAAGALGVEMGARFLTPDSARPVLDALEGNGLELAGYHVGAPLGMLCDGFEGVQKMIAAGVEFLQGRPVRNIIFSGLSSKRPEDNGKVFDERLLDDKFLEQVGAGFERLADYAAGYDVTLNYHNHMDEFKDGARLFRALARCAPSMKLAVDLGWAAAGGMDVPALLREFAPRISYVHLRDFNAAEMNAAATFEEKSESYRNLGEGDFFDASLLELLGTILGEDDWAVVEYEKGEKDPLRYKNAVALLKTMQRESSG